MRKKYLIFLLCLFGLSFCFNAYTQRQSTETAQFQNGYADFQNYIKTNLHTSKRAKRKKFYGEVEVEICINFKGEIDSVYIVGADHYELIEPIKKLFFEMPKWKAAKVRDRYVPCVLHETITFGPNLPVYQAKKE